MGYNETPVLSGGFAPVEQELTLDLTDIEGEIPKDLTGMYVRNAFTTFCPLGPCACAATGIKQATANIAKNFFMLIISFTFKLLFFNHFFQIWQPRVIHTFNRFYSSFVVFTWFWVYIISLIVKAARPSKS